MLHILHNAEGNILNAMPGSVRFLKQLRTITNFFKHSQLREYFQEMCLAGGNSRYKSMFDTWPAVFIDWRWGSLIVCLRFMDGTLAAVLRITWDSKLMSKKIVSEKAKNSAAGRDGSIDWSEIDNPTKIAAVISDSHFWCYASMLLSASEAIENIADVFNRCPCHPATPTSQRAGLNPYFAPDSRPTPCPLTGCFAPLLATGKWKVLVRNVWNKPEAELLINLSHLSVTDRAGVMNDFIAGRDSVLAELVEKLAFWEALPHLLVGLADEDLDLARSVAGKCMQMYDNRGPFLPHGLSVWMLDRQASPIRTEIERFFRGEALSVLPALELEVGKLALIPTVERPVEAAHATAKQDLRLLTDPSPAALSLAIRMPEIVTLADSTASAIQALASDFQKLRTPMGFVQHTGTVNHASLVEELDSRGKLRDSVLSSVFYHVDARTKHLKHASVAKAWGKRRDNERKSDKKLHENISQERKETKQKANTGEDALNANVLSVIHGHACQHLSSTMKAVLAPNVVASCKLVASLKFEKIESRYIPHDAQSDDLASLAKSSALDLDDVNAVAAMHSTVDPLNVDAGAFIFFQVVNVNPSKRSIVVPTGSSGVASTEMMVTVHQVADLDFDAGSAQMSQTPLFEDHLLWTLPQGTSISELGACLRTWEMEPDLDMVIKQHHYLNDLDLDVVKMVYRAVVDAAAIVGSDKYWHLVNSLDDEDAEKQLATLVKLRERGLFTSDISLATRSSWQITRRGLEQVAVRRTLRLLPSRPLEPAGEALLDLNVWELLYRLDRGGFSMRAVAKKAKRKGLPIHDASTEDRAFFLREDSRIKREYLLALLLTSEHKWAVPHLKSLEFYRKLLHDNNVLRFKSLEDKKEKKKPALVDSVALEMVEIEDGQPLGVLHDADGELLDDGERGDDQVGDGDDVHDDGDDVHEDGTGGGIELDGSDKPSSRAESETEQDESEDDGEPGAGGAAAPDGPDEDNKSSRRSAMPSSNSSSSSSSSDSDSSSSSDKKKKTKEPAADDAGPELGDDVPAGNPQRRRKGRLKWPAFMWGDYYVGHSAKKWYIFCGDDSHHLPKNKCRREHQCDLGDVASDDSVLAQRRLMWWALMACHESVANESEHKGLCL